jgi:hypothetical protein
MHSPSPADELADIRADIARLKLLEAALRAKILASPDRQPIGRWHRIEVIETKARVFDAKLLPDAIRGDQRFYRDRVTQVVRCLALPAAGTPQRPGWPIQQGSRSVQDQAVH